MRRMLIPGRHFSTHLPSPSSFLHPSFHFPLERNDCSNPQLKCIISVDTNDNDLCSCVLQRKSIKNTMQITNCLLLYRGQSKLWTPDWMPFFQKGFQKGVQKGGPVWGSVFCTIPLYSIHVCGNEATTAIQSQITTFLFLNGMQYFPIDGGCFLITKNCRNFSVEFPFGKHVFHLKFP